MSADQAPPEHVLWARKLHEAAVDLRLRARSAASLNLARRLERHAQAILFPQLPRWWADGHPDHAGLSGIGGDD